MDNCSFKEYIDFLRDNINYLISYKKCTGTLEPNLLKIRNDLFHQDPFVVIGASIQAIKAFSDQNLYH